MTAFVFMLTRNDETVPDAHALLDRIEDLGLAHIGFKDVGLPFPELRTLASRIHDLGARAYLEVVSVAAEDELRSVKAAVDLGVDVVLGGTHVDDALAVLSDAPVLYFPFPGRVEGHPSRLLGPADDIVTSARRLAAKPGVQGLDLLAYRFDGDAAALTAAVAAAVEVPVLAAGSVDGLDRIQAVRAAGAWGFTIGTAVLDGTLRVDAPSRDIRGLLSAVMAAA